MSLSYALVNLTGEQTSGDPVDPSYEKGDINADANVRDFPLYRVKFSGYDIVEIVPLFISQKSLEKQLQEFAKSYVDSKHQVFSVTLTTEGWVGDAAPYTQDIAVAGLLATDTPHYGVVYSANAQTALLEKEAFSLVDDLDTSDGKVTFTCFEDKPAVALRIQMEVNR